MTFEQAKRSHQGTKITHQYFSPHEWLIIIGNTIHFEDKVCMSIADFLAGRKWAIDGWRVYNGN